MTEERGQKVEELYRSARQCEAEQRSAFLSEACLGDEELKREVELLLAKDAPGNTGLGDTVLMSMPTAVLLGHVQKRLKPGTQLGPYTILGVIGAGGMGEVFRALDPRLGRNVAIKVLPEHLSHDPQALARFELEARAIARLSHANIVSIFDIGNDQGINYLVTELLEGASLRSRIKRGPIPWRQAVDLGIAIAEALVGAHSKGLIHRDLKPENVFLTLDHRVKLLDFGIARWKPHVRKQEDGSVLTETLAATVMGTVGYMSPEQVRGEPADAPSDIFSFGCVLYEMVTGKRAFHGPSAAETMAAILREWPIPPGKLQFHIPLDLDHIITRCLEKEPQGRFQDAPALIAALKTITESAAGSEIAKPLATAGAMDSIAVLPFANISGNPDLEYLTDGITDSLINSLSQLRGMRVVARTTVFKYKGQPIDPETAGRALKVRAILMGRVAQRGEFLDVQSELVDVQEGSQLWGQQYRHKLTDIFVVQETIAREITKKLKLKLTRAKMERLTRRYTEDSEAYQLFLRGRYYWNKRTPAWMRKGIEHFELAIQKDPGYALAHAGLADCYALLGSYGALSPQEAFQKSRDSALNALAIDKTLADAHSPLAFVQGFYEWDWRGAERGFKRAIDLSPSFPTFHWYGYLLMALGRLDEAFVNIRQALDSDPLALVINAQLAWAMQFARRYDDAIEQARKTLEMDPAYGLAHLWMGLSYLHKGSHDVAISSLQTAHKNLDMAPIVLGALGYAYAINGRSEEAHQALVQLAADAQRHYVTPVAQALIYIGLGELDQAFEWFEKALEDRSWWLAWLKVDPLFDRARSDPRFPLLMSRVGLS
jgi:serine/threonine protein kinase/tetratricopeptide (TPR) repeat protein